MCNSKEATTIIFSEILFVIVLYINRKPSELLICIVLLNNLVLILAGGHCFVMAEQATMLFCGRLETLIEEFLQLSLL